MRIDSHHHLWDLSIHNQTWIDPVEMAAIYRDFSTSDLRKAIVNSNIDHTVLVQTVTDYTETPDMLALADKDPLIAGVVGWLEIDAPEAMEHLDEYLNLPGASYLKSIRDIAQDHADANYLARPQAIKNVQELGRRGFAYDLLTKPRELAAGIEMVKGAPNTQFIMDHISKPFIKKGIVDPWANQIKELASYENVVCKVSGLVTEADWENWKVDDFKPYFEIILESFGSKRLMFGSDWPVCTLGGSYDQVVGLVEELAQNLSESEKSDLWGDVAISAYKLTP